MNERIKQLAEQAGIELPNNVVDGINGPGVVSEKDKLAKFAELIVRECIWAFGETRTEPSLEKYILDRLGIIK
jgi:hypothetical protein